MSNLNGISQWGDSQPAALMQSTNEPTQYNRARPKVRVRAEKQFTAEAFKNTFAQLNKPLAPPSH